MKKIIIPSLLIATAISSQAASISLYNFTAGSTASTDSDTDSVSGLFATGNGVVNADQFEWTGASGTATTQADAVTNGDFAEFTITINAGFTADLNSLNFDHGINNFAFGGANTSRVGVYADQDNNGFAIGDQIEVFSYPSTGSATNARSVDLTGQAALQGLTGTETFRFYFSDFSGSATRQQILDNVTLDATITPVPEPSSTALLGLGGLALILRRRK